MLAKPELEFNINFQLPCWYPDGRQAPTLHLGYWENDLKSAI